VERALKNLRREGWLNPQGLRRAPLQQLRRRLRPAGYFRQKARRLKTFLAYLDGRYGGSLNRMFAQPTTRLREELLALNGVGPETADSILLYAGGHAVFPVDAYTRRILARHGILPLTAPYEQIRGVFEKAVGPAPTDYNELHALLVRAGKQHCRREPQCEGCPLQDFLTPAMKRRLRQQQPAASDQH